MTGPDLLTRSSLICNYLKKLDIYNAARSVAMYSDANNEVRTDDICRDALESGKSVYFPRVAGETLTFHRIDFPERLVPGAYGIAEPPPNCTAIEAVKLDLIIVPGVAFDIEGGRIGYGKGYYDRALAGADSRKIVGLSFGMQLYEKVPAEGTDVRVGTVISETGIVFCSSNKGGK